MNESLLVKECLRGNPESQRQLFEHYAPKMLGVCYRYARSRDEAEDFLQEAFIKVFRKLNQYKGEGELGAWIRRIVVTTSLNGIKARHRFTDNQTTIPLENVSDSLNLIEPAADKELVELIHKLPTGYKTIFNLYVIEGYSHDEIGKMLNIKPGTSRSQLMKARKMLMTKLNADINNKNNDSHG